MSTIVTVHPVVKLIQSGQLDKAEQAIATAAADEQPLFKAMLLERRGEWSAAAGAYEAIMAKDPENKDAVFHLAYICDLRGDDERALELYEEVALGAPAHVNALLNLVVIYEECGRYEDALGCVERVLEEYPNHERARTFHRDVMASMDMVYDEDREKTMEKRDAILDTSIADFELSVRSRNCLKQMDIHTLGDLLRATASELLSYKNFGETSLHEIETMLAQKGLHIGQLLEESDPDVSKFLTSEDADPVKAGLLGRTVAELELSVRARKCLMRLGVNSINELVDRSEPELLSIKNFGMTSLAEIKKRLAEIGLSLKT